MIMTVPLSKESKITWWSNEEKRHGLHPTKIGILDIQDDSGFVELTVEEQIELLRFLKIRYEHLL